MPADRRSDHDVVERALAAPRSSKRIAFRRAFTRRAPGTWPELAKDVVALANSGGGIVVIGVDSRGEPTGWNADELLRLPRAEVTRGLSAFLGEDLHDLEIDSAKKNGQRLAVIRVGARGGVPIVFEKPGTYVDADGNEHTPFAAGSVYFRHGGVSGPARARDLARFAQQEEIRIRRDLWRNLRHVSRAPTGSEVIVVPPGSAPARSVERFRVVDDPEAAVLARTDFDVTHPYRQTELVREVNTRLGRDVVGPYDILCVRRVHGTDAREEFFHRPKFGSPQYSEAFVRWLLDQYGRNRAFFEEAKEKAKRR